MTNFDSADRPASPALSLLVLSLSLLGAGSMVFYYAGLFIPRLIEARVSKNLDGGYSFGNDFYQIWLTSRECLPHRCNPYSEEMTRRIQTGLYGRPLNPNLRTDPKDRRSFPYPFFADLLFWPASQMSFPLIRVVVVIVLAILTAISFFLWAQALGWQPGRAGIGFGLCALLSSYPALEGLYAAQIGLLVAFLFASSILALRRDKLLLSGVLMAFTTLKPQTMLLAIVYILLWSFQDWRTRRRFWAGWLATMLALVGSALIVWPQWIRYWLSVVIAYHGYTPPPILIEFLKPPLGALAVPAGTVIIVALVSGAALLMWQRRSAAARSDEFWLTLSIVLAITTVALLPGQAIYDHVLLLPGVLLLARDWRTWSGTWIFAALRWTGACMLIWPWLAAVAVILLKPRLSHEAFQSVAVFSLPLRMSTVFPFVVLACCLLVLRSRQIGSGERVLSRTRPLTILRSRFLVLFLSKMRVRAGIHRAASIRIRELLFFTGKYRTAACAKAE